MALQAERNPPVACRRFSEGGGRFELGRWMLWREFEEMVVSS